MSEPLPRSVRLTMLAQTGVMGVFAAVAIAVSPPQAPVWHLTMPAPIDTAYHALGSPFGPLCDTDEDCLRVHGHGMG